MAGKPYPMKTTTAEETRAKARNIVESVIRSCINAGVRLQALSADRGGKAKLIAELGDDAAKVQSAYADINALVTKLSDLDIEEL